jgi:hypothetical protein
MVTPKKAVKEQIKYDSLSHGIWTNVDEEKFLDGLGGHRRDALPRLILLEKYVDFMQNSRVNFGKLNQDILIGYAKKAIIKNEPPKVGLKF